MRIVVDTNVLISGVFFGGFPKKILSASVERKIRACASMEILNGKLHETLNHSVRM